MIEFSPRRSVVLLPTNFRYPTANVPARERTVGVDEFYFFVISVWLGMWSGGIYSRAGVVGTKGGTGWVKEGG